jgi:hypothetical protein
MTTLRQSAGDVSRQFQNLAPFANAARPALIELGNSAQQSQAPLVATLPLAQLGVAAFASNAGNNEFP